MTKKPRVLWFRNKEVVSHKKELKLLRQELASDESRLDKLYDEYYKCVTQLNSHDWSEKLSLESVKEFYEYMAGKKKSFALQAISSAAGLRKSQDELNNKLDILEFKIKENEIDILLSKVKCIQEKIDKDG